MTDTSHDDVAAHWDRNADQWAEDVRNGYDTYREHFTLPAFKAFLPSLDGLDVIDFGCGEGTNTRRFAKMGARMTGIDISERMIDHARKTEEVEPLGVQYAVSSYSQHSGFDDQSFDGVVSTMALMDGPDFDAAMTEAFRLLRPGGFIAFSILHPCFLIPGVRWSTNLGDDEIGLGKARYFERASFVENWKFGCRPPQEEVEHFSVPRFPRTMSDYINAIAKAGFCIKEISEPQPSDEACDIVPRLSRWRDLVAFLLMVRAEKPHN